MTDTTDTSGAPAGEGSRSRGGLNTKLMPELKAIASGLGIKTAGMKKADLVVAIGSAQAGHADQRARGVQRAAEQSRPREGSGNEPAKELGNDPGNDSGNDSGRTRGDAAPDGARAPGRGERNRRGDQPGDQHNAEDAARSSAEPDQPQGGGRRGGRDRGSDGQSDKQSPKQQPDKQGGEKKRTDQRDHQGSQQGRRDAQDDGSKDARNHSQDDGQGDGQNDGQGDDDQGGSRRNRRRRGRDRERPQGGSSSGGRNRSEPDTQILEDDVLTPCAGILDVLDNYAFVRTSGYLPGTEDVYVSLSMVRKLGLRRGDAITGQVRQPREGERKEKFNPLVSIDSVNGGEPEAARSRVEFSKLTPLYPSERLRLETDASNMIGRIVDIAAPIGKGQRGLIVSPAKAGKTMILQSIANSVSHNNPECHLMVVLVDERPEEVTDFERSVNGEVISSTFDRPAGDHTTVAELAIERAKRLVELGHDVVVLLDGITRLGRAYNLATPASGRILSGGVDSAALYPPKRFFGAARNVENGGSLTIVATALIESGSKMDEVIFEEFKGTGNMELRLRRDFADKRIFPAIDAVQSGTRREEMLMSEQELAIVWKLRRVLSGLEGQQALELLLERLKKSRNNYEFLMSVQKSTPEPASGVAD